MGQTDKSLHKSPSEVMRELRLKMLTTQPSELGQKLSPEYPRVCGVLMDWPLENGTASVVSLSTGDASIYTTGSFGIIGGIGHETVQTGAKNFVKVAEKYYGEGTVTNDYPYAQPQHVRFYLLCYDGTRVIDADLDSVREEKNAFSDLFFAGQQVVTELRLVTQKRASSNK